MSIVAVCASVSPWQYRKPATKYLRDLLERLASGNGPGQP